MVAATVVSVLLIASLTLAAGRSWTALAGFTVVCGFAQASLITLFESDALQYLDDVPAVVLVVVGVGRLIASRERRDRLAVSLGIATLAVVAFAYIRSPDPSVGFAQARQVLLPVGLVLAGYGMRDMIVWRRLWNVVLVVATLTAVWMVAEEVMQAPMINPVWYYTQSVGGSLVSLRLGLPPAYLADVPGGVIFRPGGPYMNPPVAGFVLGAGAYAAMQNLRGGTRVFVLLLIGVALAFATARAGLVIFAIVTVVYWAWNKLGRFAAVIIAALFGGYALSVFSEQGNTASHTDGLLTGVFTVLGTPLGLGFGVTGYQAGLAGAEVGSGAESLLGLYFSWLGLSALLGVAAVAVAVVRVLIKLPRRDSLPAWVAIATLTTAAVSESASSIAATPALWMAVGLALSQRPTATRKSQPVDDHREVAPRSETTRAREQSHARHPDP